MLFRCSIDLDCLFVVAYVVWFCLALLMACPAFSPKFGFGASGSSHRFEVWALYFGQRIVFSFDEVYCMGPEF